jgi:hypothetical protein
MKISISHFHKNTASIRLADCLRLADGRFRIEIYFSNKQALSTVNLDTSDTSVYDMEAKLYKRRSVKNAQQGITYGKASGANLPVLSLDKLDSGTGVKLNISVPETSRPSGYIMRIYFKCLPDWAVLDTSAYQTLPVEDGIELLYKEVVRTEDNTIYHLLARAGDCFIHECRWSVFKGDDKEDARQLPSATQIYRLITADK